MTASMRSEKLSIKQSGREARPPFQVAPPGIEREAKRAPIPRGNRKGVAGFAERPLEDCPSWDRTRTLLIQSQACCQLHQGALMELRGLEPLTSWVRSRRSPS